MLWRFSFIFNFLNKPSVSNTFISYGSKLSLCYKAVLLPCGVIGVRSWRAEAHMVGTVWLFAVLSGQCLQRTSLFCLSSSFPASIFWIPLDDAFEKFSWLCLFCSMARASVLILTAHICSAVAETWPIPYEIHLLFTITLWGCAIWIGRQAFEWNLTSFVFPHILYKLLFGIPFRSSYSLVIISSFF